jgi:serine phosphatase RsbU (regulator of sigma subunit)
MEHGQALDYAAVFAAVPIPLVVLDRDLVVREANEAYQRVTGQSRDSLVGHPLIEAFGDGHLGIASDTIRNLRAALEHSRDTGLTNTIAVQRFDLPSANGTDNEPRYWSTLTIPIFGPDGEVSLVLHRAEDITSYVLTTDPAAPADSVRQVEADLVARGHELQDANERLRQDVERERHIALTLQNAVLTPPPRSDGLAVAVRHAPAAEGHTIGGDWYDGYVLRDGRTSITVGDVTGHDIGAAASMAQLRGIVRAIAFDTRMSPSHVLGRADAADCGLGLRITATCVMAQIDAPSAGGTRYVRWSNAGHPPPLVIRADGVAALLQRPPDLMIGVAPGSVRHDHTTKLAPGDTLVLYTDGLVERRDRSMRASLVALLDAASGLNRMPLEEACDALVERLRPTGEDDIALIAARPSS